MEVRLCGDIELRRGQESVSGADLPGRQGRLALAVLVLERHRAVTRDEIADALWPAGLPKSWDDSLNAVVSRLRKSFRTLGLDNAVQSASGRLRLLLPDDCAVDVETAAAEVDRAEAALASDDHATAVDAATAAEAITRQPLLPEIDAPWLAPRRAALSHLRMRALECRAQAYTGRAAFQAAIDDAERVLEADPFRESAWRLLMTAHSAAGNPAQALVIWERCRRTLSTELGTDPSRETHAVYIDALRMYQPPSKVRPPSVEELLREAAAGLGGPDEASALRRIDDAYTEIRSLLASGDLQMATDLAGYWSIRGLWNEGRNWLTLALEQHPDADPRLIATAQIASAEMARSQGAVGDADALLESAEQIASELRDAELTVRVRVGRAAVALTRGEADAARALYEDALGDGSDDRASGRCNTGLGVLAAMRGDFSEARERFGNALDAHRRLGDLRNVAMSLSNLAAVAGSHGAPMEARAFLEESLAIRRHLADRPGLALSLVNLGIMLKSAGRPAEAIAPLEESLAIRRQLGDRSGMVGCLNSLGDVVREMGDTAGARRAYSEAVDVARRIGDRDKLCLALLSMVNLETASGEPSRAAPLLAEAIDLAVELEAKALTAAALEAAAGLAVVDDLPSAASLIRAAEELRTQIGAPLQAGDRTDVDRVLATVSGVEAAAISTAEAIDLARAVVQQVSLQHSPGSRSRVGQ